MLPSFHGLSNEDPYRHLDEFLEICSTVKIQQFPDEALRLRLFPFSLKDKAKHWLTSFTTRIITTWAQLQQEFLKKYFPIGKTNQIRRAITSFSHQDGEQFHESWERLQDIIRSCPHHKVPTWQLVQCFYDGLSDSFRQMVDASCGGTFMTKNDAEAWELFENLSENSLHHASSSRLARQSPQITQKRGGIYEIHQMDVIQRLDDLSRRFDQFSTSSSHPPAPLREACLICSSTSHPLHECPSAYQFPELVHEHVNATQSFTRPGHDPYANTYNPGWRNHPNSGWKQQSPGHQPSEQFPLPRPTFQPYGHAPPLPALPAPVPNNSVVEDKLDKVLSALGNMDSKLQSQQQMLNSHTQSISKLESQMGQIANAMNRRDEGRLPGQVVGNPKGQFVVEDTHYEQVKSITTLRSGTIIDNKVGETTTNLSTPQGVADDVEQERAQPFKRFSTHSDVPLTSPPPPSISTDHPSVLAPHVQKAPFPQSLTQPSPYGKKGHKIEDMLEVFKQVKINLPFLDAISQIPAYAKFLKDLCTQKRKIRSHMSKKVFLTEQVSSILQSNTPPKFKDPGAPTIACIIGNHSIDRALLDLGASVNLIPFSVYEQLGLGELKPTSVTLQLADRSMKIPRGVIEDVIIKVDKFYFPVDFLVLDMEHVPNAGKQIPIILGRPFLATANACINCRTGVMNVSFGNMKVKLNVFHAGDQSSVEDECFMIDVLDELVADTSPSILGGDLLPNCRSHSNCNSLDMYGSLEEVNSLSHSTSTLGHLSWRAHLDHLLTIASTHFSHISARFSELGKASKPPWEDAKNYPLAQKQKNKKKNKRTRSEEGTNHNHRFRRSNL